MKKIITALAIFASSIAFSQVGIGTTSPHSSSILDLTASDKALLLPRVANSNKIATPVDGMMIYSTSQKCFKGYQNTEWVDITTCIPVVTSAITFNKVNKYNGVSVINNQGIGYNGEAIPASSTIEIEVNVTVATAYSFTATDANTGLTYSASGNFAAAGTYPVVLQNNGAAIPWDTYGVLTMTLTGAKNTLALAPRIDIKSIPTTHTDWTYKDVTYGGQTWMDRNQSLDTSIQSGNYNGKRTALASSKSRQITVKFGKCVNEINGSHTACINPFVIVLVPIVHIERVVILQSTVIKPVIHISRQVDRNAVDTDFQNNKTFSGTFGFSVIGTDACARHIQQHRPAGHHPGQCTDDHHPQITTSRRKNPRRPIIKRKK
jgi:hypothetical protein